MIALIILLGVATAAYAYLKWCYSYWSRRNVPGPEPSYFVGNIGPTISSSKNMCQVLDDWYEKFNGVPYIGYYKLMSPAIVACDAELIKNILTKDFASFHSNEFKLSLKNDPLVGLNPFFLDGDAWQASRKIVTSVLSPAKLKSLFPAMQITCERLVDHLRTFSPTDDVESHDPSILYTTENVVRSGFSLDANCFDKSERSIFLKARDAMFEGTTIQAICYALLPVLPAWSLDYSPIRIISRETDAFFRKLVNDNKKSRRSHQPMNDLFEAVLKLQEASDTNNDLLTGHALTLYLDGTETSSRALAFALFCLAENADAQERLYAEVIETLEKNNGQLTYEALNGMKYLENVLSESLRLYPPATQSAKMCTRTYVLPSIGRNPPVSISPGTVVTIPIRALHLDPKNFSEPTKFQPERFYRVEVRNSPVYLPFGNGPRMCPGLRFAFLQVRVALFHVVKNFRLTLSPNHKPFAIDPLNPMMGAKDGLLINFTQRINAKTQLN